MHLPKSIYLLNVISISTSAMCKERQLMFVSLLMLTRPTVVIRHIVCHWRNICLFLQKYIYIYILFSPLLIYSTLYIVLTVSAVAFAIFRVYLAFSPKPARAPTEASPPTMEQRAVTHSELAKSTGENGSNIFIALKDPFSDKITVFDVSPGRDFYGPGGAYHVFVGKNATHGLACSTVDPDKVEGDLSTLTESQKDTHLQWHAKYMSKYPVVGFLVSDDYKEDDTASTVTTDSAAKKDS